MNLYWHRWRYTRGKSQRTVYLLVDRPWHGDESKRSTGETAIVHRLNGRWHGTANVDGWFVMTGSAASARAAIERHLDRKSIGLFGEDVTIHQAAQPG